MTPDKLDCRGFSEELSSTWPAAPVLDERARAHADGCASCREELASYSAFQKGGETKPWASLLARWPRLVPVFAPRRLAAPVWAPALGLAALVAVVTWRPQREIALPAAPVATPAAPAVPGPEPVVTAPVPELPPFVPPVPRPVAARKPAPAAPSKAPPAAPVAGEPPPEMLEKLALLENLELLENWEAVAGEGETL